MNGPLPRIIGTGALLALFCLGSEYMRYRGGANKEIVLPEISLETMPREFGPPGRSWSWNGKEMEVDPYLFRVIGANEVVSRSYTNAASKELTVHAAVFGSYFRGAPHPPTVCYPSSGWIQTDRKDVVLEARNAPPAPAQMIAYDKEGSRVLILYWFQLGNQIFTDDQGLSDARRALRQNPTWPAIVKVLLQTQITNAELDEQRLKDFGAGVYAWTSQIQKVQTPTPSAEADEAVPAAEAEAK
jgi:EpsI family protein